MSKVAARILEGVSGTTSSYVGTNSGGTEGVFALPSGGGQTLYDAIVDAAGGGDYTTLGAAIAAGEKGIFMRDGTYSEVNVGIADTDAVTTICGESRSGVILDFTGTGTGAFTIEGTAVTSTGTALFTNGSATVTGTGTTFTSAAGGDYISHTNNDFDQTLMEIFFVSNDTSLTLRNNWGGETKELNFAIVTPVKDLVIKNLTISNGSGTSYMLHLNRLKDIILDNVTFFNGTTSASTNVRLERSSEISFTECLFDTNRSVRFGMNMASGSGYSIANCKISNLLANALLVQGCVGVSITDNLFSHSGRLDIGGKHVLVSGNTFLGGQQLGRINTTNLARWVQITSNHFRDTTIGISVTASNWIEIVGNMFYRPSTAIIVTGGAGYTLINGNHIYAHTVNGINLSATTFANVIGNFFQGGTGSAIRVNSDRNIINANYMTNVSSGNGIELTASSDDNLVTNNVGIGISVPILDNGTNNSVFTNKTTTGGEVSRLDTLTAGTGITNDGTAFDPDISVDETVFAEKILGKISSIDGKTVATTNLYTVPGGTTAVITKAMVRVTADSAITTNPIAGIGVAAGEDDIFESQELLNMQSTGQLYHYVATGTSVVANASDVVKLGIDTGASGTTLTLEVTLFGYEF